MRRRAWIACGALTLVAFVVLGGISFRRAELRGADQQGQAVREGQSEPPQQQNIVEFFQSLLDQHLANYKLLRQARFQHFCEEVDLRQNSGQNEKAFYTLYFLHDLFTSNSASNCARGGFLKIPYLWHWVTPNPRHRILRHGTQRLLVDESPPRRFARYASTADIDRVPSLYLADLLTAEPQYEHPSCGTMYTFGWCSEREMAFCLLASFLGFRGKIVQSNNHVWSEFCLQLQSGSDGTRLVRLRIDNTFDDVSWTLFPANANPEEWLNEHQSVGHERWYNARARSEDEISRVSAIPVPFIAQERLRQQVDTALREALARGSR